MNVSKGVKIKSGPGCYCLDKTANPATTRTSGSFDYDIYYDDSITTDISPIPFNPSAISYPHGISISTKSGSLSNGQIVAGIV